MLELQKRTDAQGKSIENSEDLSPATYLSVDLKELQRTELEGWIKGHLDSISMEMAPVLARFQDETAQLEGQMPAADYPYPGAFRISDPVTKKKVRETANRIKQAYFDSDPIWSVSGKDMTGLFEYVQAVERSLDTMVDHDLEAEDDLSMAIFNAVLHGSGFLIPTWDYHEEIVRDFETYDPFDLALAQQGMVDESLEGLRKFEENYPDWKDDAGMRKIHSTLRSGKKFEGEFSYREPIRNLPEIVHIDPEHVRVYPSVKGYSGLRRTPIYGYVQEHSFHELESMAQDEFIDQEALDRLVQGKTLENRSAKDDMEPFEIFKATIRYRLPGDSFPVRYKIWYETNRGILLRIRSFTWWNRNPDLIPLYIRQEDPGFFKRGLAWDLQENQTIASLMWSMFFNAVDMANSMRWKVKHKSMAEQHLLSRRWAPSLPIPLVKDPHEVDSMVTPTSHIGQIVQAIELNKRAGDEETQTSSLQSGRESPNDPTAPATKVIALLQQMEPNTKEFIRSMEPGIRQVGQSILWMYYQAISLKWVKAMPGVPEIPRGLLREIAENLNTRALLFESDRKNLLQSNLMVLKTMIEIYGTSRPDLIARAFRIFVSQVNSQWAKLVDELDLSPPAPPPAAPAGQPGPMGPGGGGPGPLPPSPMAGLNGNGVSDRLLPTLAGVRP